MIYEQARNIKCNLETQRYNLQNLIYTITYWILLSTIWQNIKLRLH